MTTDGLEPSIFRSVSLIPSPTRSKPKCWLKASKASDANNSEMEQMVKLYKTQNIEAMVNSVAASDSDLAP